MRWSRLQQIVNILNKKNKYRDAIQRIAASKSSCAVGYF